MKKYAYVVYYFKVAVLTVYIFFHKHNKVGIMGTIHYWGLTISVMNTVFLVLAVGLSVDYSSHIGHTFMTTSGKPSGKLPISCPQFSGFLASG